MQQAAVSPVLQRLGVQSGRGRGQPGVHQGPVEAAVGLQEVLDGLDLSALVVLELLDAVLKISARKSIDTIHFLTCLLVRT